MCKFTTIILLCCCFFGFTSQVSGQNFDINTLRTINNTTATIGYSKFISNTTTSISFAVPVVMGVTALIEKDDILLKDALYVGVTIGLAGVITQGMKVGFNRPRPIVTYPDLQAYEGMLDLSFPSGHTSLAFSTAAALCFKYPKWYVIAPSALWACSVGYSRMNLGVHYPSDVFAGALVGVGSAYVSYLANNWFWKKQNNRKIFKAWEVLPVKE